MKDIDILIPTFNRASSLAVSLSSLAFQDFKNFNVIISNQGDSEVLRNNYSIKFTIRLLNYHGNEVSIVNNFPPKGMAQQRQFLLDQSQARFCLYLDDDVVLEPFAVKNMISVIKNEKCGFVGMPVMGLSFLEDFRQDQEIIEFWNTKVVPETILPELPTWERFKLHSAANALHVQNRLKIKDNNPKIYKVAWVGGCTMFDKKKLIDSGGFKFWKKLPKVHVGEDVYAQLQVLKRYGGCGVLPSGAYHQELPTTLSNRTVDAPKYLPIN